MSEETQENELQIELKNKRICRFCMTQNEHLTNIYSKENRLKNSAPLPLQIMSCISIEVFTNDGMPSTICDSCCMLMEYFYRFKQMCKKSDTALRQYPLTGKWPVAFEIPKLCKDLIFKMYPTLKQQFVEPTVNKLITKSTSEQVKILNPDKRYQNTQQVMYELSPSTSNSTQSNQIQIKKHQLTSSVPSSLASCSTTLIPSEQKSQSLIISQKTLPKISATKLTKPSIPDSVPMKPLSMTTFQKVSEKQQPQPKPKLLNKSSIKILNKDAQKRIEPIISQPIVKLNSAGNIEIVSAEIIDPELKPPIDPIKNAAPVETNVFPCLQCERSFPLRQLLEIHMINHRKRSFQCETCSKCFFSKYDLSKHQFVHTGEKPHKCVVCGKAFSRSTLLHRHEKVHTDQPKFICIYCEKPFLSKEGMDKHAERHLKLRPFSCTICNKSFAFKQGLERHELVHSKDQPYPCQYCPFSFSTPSKLVRHLTAHAGERPFPCKLCSKSYLLSHHLTRHLRSHKQGSGSYKCFDCEQIFTTRDDLIYHSAVHATQTLTCPLCKEHFNDLDSVTEHIKNHSDGEQFACEFCDLIFMTAEKLRMHCDKMHSDDLAAYEEHDKNAADDVKTENVEIDDYGTDESQESYDNEDEVVEEYIVDDYVSNADNCTNESKSTNNDTNHCNIQLVTENNTIKKGPVKRSNNSIIDGNDDRLLSLPIKIIKLDVKDDDEQKQNCSSSKENQSKLKQQQQNNPNQEIIQRSQMKIEKDNENDSMSSEKIEKKINEFIKNLPKSVIVMKKESQQNTKQLQIKSEKIPECKSNQTNTSFTSIKQNQVNTTSSTETKTYRSLLKNTKESQQNPKIINKEIKNLSNTVNKPNESKIINSTLNSKSFSSASASTSHDNCNIKEIKDKKTGKQSLSTAKKLPLETNEKLVEMVINNRKVTVKKIKL